MTKRPPAPSILARAEVAARSYLFVPGDRPERFPKAWNAGADAVILDLEDAVTAERKAEARRAVCGWMSPERPVYVRINGTKTEWFRGDLEAVVRPGLRGIVLPKAESPEEVTEVVRRLPEGALVLPLVETARGVWNARELAETPGVERLVFGSIDLQLDAGIQGDDEELLYARSRIVLASRVAGILPPVDGVTASLDDAGRLAADAERAVRLGFGGKLCIHPKQIKAVHKGFAPAERKIAWARKVMESAGSAGSGAIRVDGEMVDRPVVERARAILERARP